MTVEEGIVEGEVIVGQIYLVVVSASFLLITGCPKVWRHSSGLRHVQLDRCMRVVCDLERYSDSYIPVKQYNIE